MSRRIFNDHNRERDRASDMGRGKKMAQEGLASGALWWRHQHFFQAIGRPGRSYLALSTDKHTFKPAFVQDASICQGRFAALDLNRR